VVNYCDHHSGHAGQLADAIKPVQAGNQAVSRHRRSAGTAGPSARYDDCDDYRTRRDWKSDAGRGGKNLRVRRIHNDLTFIDEFLTLDLRPRAATAI
jgi:stage V sporulation protein R